MSEPELKPCPFCGGAAMFRKALWPSDGDTDAVIHHGPADCGMVSFYSDRTDESVVAAWNARATDARIAALEEVAKREVAAQQIFARIRKVRDGYANQARFADVEPAGYFREFVRRLDKAVNPETRKSIWGGAKP